MWARVQVLAYLVRSIGDMAMKQFAAPLGMTTLPDVEFDEILDHNPKKGWSSTKNFIYYSSRANGEKTLTTSGEVGYYQARSGGRILQHIFTKEHWDKDKAWEYLEGLAEKAIKLLSFKLRFEDITPVKLSVLDDEDLSEGHDRLHRYYAEWLVGEHREEDDWSYGDLLQKHAFVVDELKKRGKKCEYDDELAKPIRKGLVEAIKEATESFIWDGWDESVLVVKGGPGDPGSGHHGHAGRPGYVGGSAAGSGLAKSLPGIQGYSELDKFTRDELRMGANAIPDRHFEGAEIQLDAERIESFGARACGEYNPDTGVITLHPDLVDGMTLTHEVGHHVWHSGQVGGDLQKSVDAEWERGFKLSPDEMRAVGMRGRNWALGSGLDEFWADSYSLWARGKRAPGLARDVQGRFSMQFPETAKILDNLFKQE